MRSLIHINLNMILYTRVEHSPIKNNLLWTTVSFATKLSLMEGHQGGSGCLAKYLIAVFVVMATAKGSAFWWMNLDSIFWILEHPATRLDNDMVIHQFTLSQYAIWKRLLFYIQGQGHSESVMVHIIMKIWLFLLYALNGWPFCNQT